MKKSIQTLFLTSALIVFMTSFVKAQQITVEGVASQLNYIIETVLRILAPYLGLIIGDYPDGEFFFIKILLLILLLVITKGILDKTPIGEDNKRISFFVALIVSVLAVRFIGENNFIGSIFIQYGVLGIAITTILPMVIFFYFVHNTKVGTYGRKMFWGLYAIILGAIWLSKSNEIPEVANWIYGLGFLASIIFIFFDKSIHGYLGLADFKKFEGRLKKETIRELRRKLYQANEDLRNGIITTGDHSTISREILSSIKKLSKE